MYILTENGKQYSAVKIRGKWNFRETVFVGAEDRPALLDDGALVIGDPLGEAVGLAALRHAVCEDREWVLRQIHFILAKDDRGEECGLGFRLLHALSSPTRGVC